MSEEIGKTAPVTSVLASSVSSGLEPPNQTSTASESGQIHSVLASQTGQPGIQTDDTPVRFRPAVAELSDICKHYGSGATRVTALDHLSLTVRRGDYLAMMGSSGSGKSTAMNILGCLDRPSSGVYRLRGTPVQDLDEDQLADLRNQDLGFVFQQFHLLPQLSALENVMLPMIYAGVSRQERRERAVSALSRVGLSQRLDNRPNQLSGGQQQRVALARAIINNPVLLLADEPTGALDSSTTREVLDLFDELHSQGMTILMVTHEQDVADRAERVLHFRDGCITDPGPDDDQP